jgi:hypothetical protein
MLSPDSWHCAGALTSGDPALHGAYFQPSRWFFCAGQKNYFNEYILLRQFYNYFYGFFTMAYGFNGPAVS